MPGVIAALWAVAGALALAYWRICATPGHGWGRSAIKTGSVAGLALAGAMAGAPGLIVAGLALGSLGDFALSRPGRAAFPAGMAAFGAGHLAYVAALMGMAGGAWPPLWAVALFGALAASTELWLAPHTGALRWPVRGYVAVIAAMGMAAAALPFGPLVVGAGLFIASDLLLAIHTFRSPRRWLALALWPAYWGGQALILLGALMARAVT